MSTKGQMEWGRVSGNLCRNSLVVFPGPAGLCNEIDGEFGLKIIGIETVGNSGLGVWGWC